MACRSASESFEGYTYQIIIFLSEYMENSKFDSFCYEGTDAFCEDITLKYGEKLTSHQMQMF